MAGIMANSATATMVEGGTSADNVVTGYLAREQITLSVTGTPTSTVWGLTTPTGSAAAAALDSETDATPVFTPDVEGYYVVTCLVDGTTEYVLRIAVVQVANVSTLTAIRYLPIEDDAVPTPATGATVFYSSDSDGLAAKLADGSVVSIDVTP